MRIGETEMIVAAILFLICIAGTVALVVGAVVLSKKNGRKPSVGVGNILCPNCGEGNPGDNKFCEHCGSSLEDNTS